MDSQVDNNTLKVEVTHPARLAEESAFGIGYMKDDRSVVPISVCYEEWPYYSNGTIIISYPFTIRGLSKGNYKVVAIKKDEGSSVWKASEDTEKSFADVNVDGNGNVTTTLYGYTTDIKVDTMVFITEPTFGSNNIKAYVSKSIDDGMTYDGDISLYAIQETPIGTNGLSTSYHGLDTKSVILKKGETQCLDFSAFISGKYYGASDADSLFTFRFCQGDFKGKKIGDFKVLVKKSPKISRNLAMTMTPTIESFNTRNGESLYFRKTVNEGSKHNVETAVFSKDRDKFVVNMTTMDMNTGQTSGRSTEWRPTRIFDLMSMIAFTQGVDTSDSEPGRTESLPMVNGNMVVQQYLVYTGNRKVKADDGHTYDCMVISIRDYKEGKERETVKAYVTNDSRHTPVQLDIILGTGTSIKAVLK